MSKSLSAKVGSFTNREGQVKGQYVKIGTVIPNENGSYVLIDPAVSLAGVLVKQNKMARDEGKPERDMIMCSVFDNNQQSTPRQQQQQPQQPQQPTPQQQQVQQDMDDGIPF